MISIRVVVNGTEHERAVEPRTSLADFLRHDLGLRGTHVGCEHGVCGACTVMIDGDPVRSCLLFAVQADGSRVTTLEGITPESGLSPLQAAFQNAHALQCGFCTPGVLITLTKFLEEHPKPDEDAVREQLAGHLCRCTGYQGMLDAVREVTT